jgi:hypothetical protein
MFHYFCEAARKRWIESRVLQVNWKHEQKMQAYLGGSQGSQRLRATKEETSERQYFCIASALVKMLLATLYHLSNYYPF